MNELRSKKAKPTREWTLKKYVLHFVYFRMTEMCVCLLALMHSPRVPQHHNSHQVQCSFLARHLCILQLCSNCIWCQNMEKIIIPSCSPFSFQKQPFTGFTKRHKITVENNNILNSDCSSSHFCNWKQITKAPHVQAEKGSDEWRRRNREIF